MNEYYMKLPRNKPEFILFMLNISIISVNIIAPLIAFFEVDFSIDTYVNTLKVLPFIWLSVIVLVLATYKPAQWMTNKILKREDSFNAHIIINILCTVFMMSIILTIVATMIGQQKISMEPIENFFYRWPRNFTIAFGVELLIAQPIARGILYLIHSARDKKKINVSEAQSANNNAVVEPTTAGQSKEAVKDPTIDRYFVEGLRLAIETQKISVSLLQRNFSIGYTRASRLVDKMEELGHISAPKGEMYIRKIQITKEEFEKLYGDKLA